MKLKPIFKIVCVLCLLAMPAFAAEQTNISSLRDIIGNPVTVFNGLEPSTKSIISWTLGLMLLVLAICVVVGVSSNTAKTAVGKKTQNAKLSTSGIMDNINIGATLLVGIIILGIAFGLIMGI
jgi:divalent metal cation (Fe/Co/Zn/Cd) transporter